MRRGRCRRSIRGADSRCRRVPTRAPHGRAPPPRPRRAAGGPWDIPDSALLRAESWTTGATGLEPATSAVTGQRSNQSELRPPAIGPQEDRRGHCSATPVCPMSRCRTPCGTRVRPTSDKFEGEQMADVKIVNTDDCASVFNGAMRLVRDGLGVESFGIQVIDLPPNADAYPEHDHSEDGQEEVYTVLRGSCTLVVGGEEHKLEPDMFARVGPSEK